MTELRDSTVLSPAPMTGTTAGKPAAGKLRRGKRRKPRIALVLALTWVVLLVVVALTVQWLPIHSPTTPAGAVNLVPSFSGEILGTDAIGRSVLSRLAYGARVSLGIALLSTIISMAIGILLGLVTVYFGRFVTVVVDVIANSVLAIPSLLLLLAIVLALDPTLVTLVIALSLIKVPHFTRLTRANAQAQMKKDYVVAARVMGAKAPRLMFREVLPNTALPLISYAVLVIPSTIVTEGSLSFLGFGVQPPTPSWGGMIAQAEPALTYAPWPAIIPCVVIFLTVFSLNTLGDHLRVQVDVRDTQL